MGSNSLDTLVELVSQLRAPDGCPWDRRQTHESITGFLIEEAYEVVHAIKEQNSESLKDELGDLLLHVAFHVQLAREDGKFELQDVLDSIHEKVIRRHPHVFGDEGAKEIPDVKLKWEELKAQERAAEKSKTNSFPALVEARKLIEKRSNLGERHVPDSSSLPEDLKYQIARLIEKGDEETIGQLLFYLVDRARSSGYEAEIALKEQNRVVRASIESESQNTTSSETP